MEELTPYELERQARLAENARLLESLGLHDLGQPVAKRQRLSLGSRCATPLAPRTKSTRRKTITGAPEQEAWDPLDHDSSTEDYNDSDEGSPKRSARWAPRKVYERNGRVYGSADGTSCHQCRQKTLDAKVSCTNIVEAWNGTLTNCTLKMCFRCLPNRYGQDVFKELKNEWQCPKCLGICNCSFCMKARGRAPTGIMVNRAKSLGFACVADMLAAQGGLQKVKGSSTKTQEKDTEKNGPITRKRKREVVEEESGVRRPSTRSSNRKSLSSLKSTNSDLQNQPEAEVLCESPSKVNPDSDDAETIPCTGASEGGEGGGGEEGGEEEEEQVDSIISAHFEADRLVFRVRWTGHPPSHDTFEPHATVSDLLAMDHFEATNRSITRPGTSTRISLRDAIMWDLEGSERVRGELAKLGNL